MTGFVSGLNDDMWVFPRENGKLEMATSSARFPDLTANIRDADASLELWMSDRITLSPASLDPG